LVGVLTACREAKYRLRITISAYSQGGHSSGNLEAQSVCWSQSASRLELSGYQTVVDCVQRIAVEDLVISQEEKPKRHRSFC